MAAADNPQLRAVVAEGVFAEVRDIETGIRLAGILSRAPFDPLVNRLVAHVQDGNLVSCTLPERRLIVQQSAVVR